MRILTDDDLCDIPTSVFVKAVGEQIKADAAGKTVSPPRHKVDFDPGALVFTCGGNEKMAGFRVYDTFPKPANAKEDQLVVAFDRETARLKGVAIGERLGAIRTGCLGGYAIQRLASARKIETMAIIGTGLQAETQLEAISAVREIGLVKIFSRKEKNRQAFAKRSSEKLGLHVVACESAKDTVANADVVVLATNSSKPVIETAWIKSGAHVTTVGPKFVGRHELPLDIIERAKLIVSDSPQQILGQGENHMFHGNGANIQHLGASHYALGEGDVTLFLSAGLSGTEVVALSAAIDYLEANKT